MTLNINEDKFDIQGDKYVDGNTYILIGFEKVYSNPNNTLVNKIVNNSISMITKSIYIHTEIIYIEHNSLLMLSASQYSNRVRKARHMLNPNWSYYRLKVDKSFIKNMLNFYEKVKYNKYDYMGILGFIFGNKDRSDRWFCSEFSSNVLKINGYEDMWCVEPSSVSPGVLATMFNMPNYISLMSVIKNMR